MVAVDLPLGGSIKLLKLPLNIIDALGLILLSLVLWEANGQRGSLDLLGEKVLNRSF